MEVGGGAEVSSRDSTNLLVRDSMRHPKGGWYVTSQPRLDLALRVSIVLGRVMDSSPNSHHPASRDLKGLLSLCICTHAP